MAIAQPQILTAIYSPSFGADPELFLTQNGNIIGAEKVIPKAGINVAGNTKIVLDGVQVELHLSPSTCRATLGNTMRALFKQLHYTLSKSEGLSASFAPVVEVSKKEMDSLDEAAKQLGCAPSLNTYDPKATIKVAKDFRQRSAGGHIHIGLQQMIALKQSIQKDPKKFIDLMDIFVGLPSVMIDRDPSVAERRKVYGRAGEYRLPSYGIEYRTLDNFWLRSYQLMSFVFGMSKIATNIYGISYVPHIDFNESLIKNWDAAKIIFDSVDLKKVQKAINTNDYDLARELWQPVAKFIRTYIPKQDSRGNGTQDYIFALDAANVDNFQYFCDEIHKKGIERWFPQEPMDHWLGLEDGHGIGWEAFLTQVVGGMRKYDELSEVIASLKKES